RCNRSKATLSVADGVVISDEMFRNAFQMKSMYQIFVAICTIALAAAGCNRASYAADDKSKVHVGIVFDAGGKDDRSFNAAAWEGVQRAAKDFPIVLRDVEPGDATSVEPAMRAFAERSYDLIIGVGFNLV